MKSKIFLLYFLLATYLSNIIAMEDQDQKQKSTFQTIGQTFNAMYFAIQNPRSFLGFQHQKDEENFQSDVQASIEESILIENKGDDIVGYRILETLDTGEVLSSYQQALVSIGLREKISPVIWNHLKGSNQSLAEALEEAIKNLPMDLLGPEKGIIEISFISFNNFQLKVGETPIRTYHKYSNGLRQ